MSQIPGGIAAFQVDDVSVEAAPMLVPCTGAMSSGVGLILALGALLRNRWRNS